jgi:dUTP pyrophosphatase
MRYPMLSPTFYTLPGEEAFAPKVAHPGEDAGGDISARVTDEYSLDKAKAFYSNYAQSVSKQAPSAKSNLFVDGKDQPSSEGNFLDLISQDGAILLYPGATVLVNSGFKILFPDLKNLGSPWSSFVPCYNILPRSGLACKHNVTVTNSPGLVDSGYQDWIKVSLTNNSNNYHAFRHGARIAQGVFALVIDQSSSQTTTNDSIFTATKRAIGGFGSTAL